MNESELEAEYAAWDGRDALIEAVGDEPLAYSMFVGLGSDALAWLDRTIPALEGRTPRRCLATRKGREAVRAVLAKLPR